ESRQRPGVLILLLCGLAGKNVDRLLQLGILWLCPGGLFQQFLDGVMKMFAPRNRTHKIYLLFASEIARYSLLLPLNRLPRFFLSLTALVKPLLKTLSNVRLSLFGRRQRNKWHKSLPP